MIILILIIVIIVLGIRYFQIANHTLNEEEFKKEVHKAVVSHRRHSRIIYCDYCGGRINTEKDRVCPACGASYGRDAENAGPDQDLLARQASDYVENKKAELYRNTADIRKKIKICLIVLIAVLAAVIAGTIVLRQVAEVHPSAGTEPSVLNESEWEDYQPYSSIEGNGVLLATDDVTVTLTALYEDRENPGNYKGEFHIQNDSGGDIRFGADCLGINGFLPDTTYSVGYDWYPKGETVIYERLASAYAYEMAGIKDIHSLQFGGVRLYDSSYLPVYDSTLPVTVYTTEPEQARVSLPEGEVLFEGYGIKILREKSEIPYEGGPLTHTVWLENTSDVDMVVRVREYMGEKTQTVYSLDGRILPRGCVMYSTFSPYYDYPAEDPSVMTREMKVTFTFESDEDPSAGFTTDFIDFR